MNTTLRDVTKYAGYRATKQQTRVKNKDLKASAPGGTPGRAPDGGASRYCDVRGKVMEKAPPSRLILSLHKTIRKQPFPPSIPAISYGWGRGKWVVGVPNPHLGEQPAIGMPKALGGPAPSSSSSRAVTHTALSGSAYWKSHAAAKCKNNVSKCEKGNPELKS